jgi:hypothetical protein
MPKDSNRVDFYIANEKKFDQTKPCVWRDTTLNPTGKQVVVPPVDLPCYGWTSYELSVAPDGAWVFTILFNDLGTSVSWQKVSDLTQGCCGNSDIQFGPGDYRGGTGSNLCDWSQVSLITISVVEDPRIICCPQTSGSGSSGVSGSGSLSVSGSVSGSGSGSGAVVIPPCSICTGLPSTVHAVFSNGTGTCSCMNGTTIALSGVPGNWSGSGTICGGQTVAIIVLCNPSGNWQISLGNACSGGTASNQQFPFTCSPLDIVLTIGLVGHCCNGTVQVDIIP